MCHFYELVHKSKLYVLVRQITPFQLSNDDIHRKVNVSKLNYKNTFLLLSIPSYTFNIWFPNKVFLCRILLKRMGSTKSLCCTILIMRLKIDRVQFHNTTASITYVYDHKKEYVFVRKLFLIRIAPPDLIPSYFIQCYVTRR